jgi:hypothetical protein
MNCANNISAPILQNLNAANFIRKLPLAQRLYYLTQKLPKPCPLLRQKTMGHPLFLKNDSTAKRTFGHEWRFVDGPNVSFCGSPKCLGDIIYPERRIKKVGRWYHKLWSRSLNAMLPTAKICEDSTLAVTSAVWHAEQNWSQIYLQNVSQIGHALRMLPY